MLARASLPTEGERRPAPRYALLRFALPLALFAVVAAPIVGDGAFPGDRGLVSLGERFWTETRGTVLETTLDAGQLLGALLAVGALVALLARRPRARAAFLALALVGPLLLTPVLKEAFDRPSVGGKPGDSFPSGSAMASTAFLAAAVLLAPSSHARRWIVGVGVPLVLGYGVLLVVGLWHHPSDVVAGWCVGLLWANVVWLALRPTAERRS